MSSPYSLVMTSLSSEVDADRLATSIVEAKLAACVQISPIRSIYSWKGDLCREAEYLLLIKTSSTLYSRLEAHIKAHHPYEVAEIIQLPIVGGSPEYLSWITDCTS